MNMSSLTPGHSTTRTPPAWQKAFETDLSEQDSPRGVPSVRLRHDPDLAMPRNLFAEVCFVGVALVLIIFAVCAFGYWAVQGFFMMFESWITQMAGTHYR